jgi:hypothetical protein
MLRTFSCDLYTLDGRLRGFIPNEARTVIVSCNVASIVTKADID